jgi:hypothetical protein
VSGGKEESIVLEPFTKITSFDGIGYAANRSLIGAIGGYLYPNDEDEAERKKFYASALSRRNKQKIAELVSEIYSYLNGIISEYADPRQYYFRLWVRMEVGRRTGEIMEHPYFDLDVFRYVGKVGGKYEAIGGYLLKVVFVGKEAVPISSIFIKGASIASKNTGLIEFRSYETYFSAPKEVKEKITRNSPYIIIGDHTYEIKVKIGEGTTIVSYIEEGKVTTEFKDENDVVFFILKKMKIKPNIIGAETAFELVDKEIKGFSPKITGKPKKDEGVSDLFSLDSLGIDAILEQLSKKLEELGSAGLSEDQQKQLKKHLRLLEGIKGRFEDLKGKYEVLEQELGLLNKERMEGVIDEEKFSSTRVKRLIALKMLRTDLVNLQQEVKNGVAGQIEEFLKQTNKAKKGEK